MASQAFERAMKKLGNPSETQLAELIMRDITQLSEDAKGECASGDLLLFSVLLFALGTLHRTEV